jgi:hypothetical protein
MAAIIDRMGLSNYQRVELKEGGVTRIVQAAVPGAQAAQAIEVDAEAATKLFDFLLRNQVRQERVVRWRGDYPLGYNFMFVYSETLTNVQQFGELIAVKLRAPEDVRANQIRQERTIVPTVGALAAIDSDVEYTLIQEGIAASLGLEPAGTTKVATLPRQIYECNQYRIQLLFPQGHVAETYAVEVPFLYQGDRRFKCLIGRDILKDSTVLYECDTDTISLIF